MLSANVVLRIRTSVGSEIVVCQAEDGIRDLVRSRGLGDVYKRQTLTGLMLATRVGAGIAAEIGSMKVTEQLDALRMLSLIHI